MTPNELLLDRLLRIAGVLLCHHEGQLRGDYCDWKEFARYTELDPVSMLSAKPLCWISLH